MTRKLLSMWIASKDRAQAARGQVDLAMSTLWLVSLCFVFYAIYTILHYFLSWFFLMYWFGACSWCIYFLDFGEDCECFNVGEALILKENMMFCSFCEVFLNFHGSVLFFGRVYLVLLNSSNRLQIVVWIVRKWIHCLKKGSKTNNKQGKNRHK